MLSESYRLYIEEVLGASPDQFSAPIPAVKAVVWTPTLPHEELQLLEKILASIHLHGHRHVQQPEDAAIPFSTPHVLAFGAQGPLGRHILGEQVWWRLPALAQMLGTSPEVSENKKRTWALLQQFAKECGP